MTIDRMGFKLSLAKMSEANETVIETVMAKMEPFFLCADAGMYGFAPAKRIKKSAVARAVETAFDMRVKKVELVSVSDPWEDWPPFFNEIVIRSSLRFFMQEGLMHLLSQRLSDIHYAPLRSDNFRSGMSAFQLENSIKDAAQRDIWKSLKKSMEKGPWPDDLWRELYRCINSALTCYIGYVLAGDADGVATIEPLIDLLPSAIPLGSMKFSMSTQIVFVA